MAGKILIPIVTAFQSAGIKDATRQLDLFGKKISGISSMGGKLKGALSLGAIGGGAFSFFKSAITEAKNYQREMNALNTIFGASAPEMQMFAQNAAKIGLSTAQAAKASTFLGSVLKQSGMPMADTIENTKKLVGLASDLATVYGYDVSEALSGMTALFRGEYDPIEKFGVAMKQAEVNTLLAARGQSHLTGQAKLYAQQIARLDLLMQRSADSSGAFAAGQGTLFVEQQNLNVAYKNFQAIIAQAVVPSIAKLMGALSDLVTQNQDSLTSLFKGIGELVSAFVQTIADNKQDIKEFVDFIVRLVDVATEGAILVARYAKAIISVGLAYAAVNIGMKAYAVLAPVVTALTYAANGGLVAMSYALGVVVTEMTILTAGVGLLIAGLVALGIIANDSGSELNVLKKAAKDVGVTVENGFNRGARRAGDYYDQIQDNIDIINSMNDAEERRFLQRHNEHLQEMDDLEEAAAVAKELAEKIADFKKSIAETIKGFLPAEFIKKEIGVFEKAVVDSLDKINKEIDGAVDDGVLGEASAKALKKYAKDEAKVLSEIAGRRDKLSKRYSMAKSLMAEIKDTVIGFGNLATIVSDVSADVTTTTTKMIGKFTSGLMMADKQLVSAGAIIDKYKDIVGRARSFKDDLEKLQGLNLNKTLLNQILGGGLDSGATAAAALAEGGQAAVDELNSLFAELSSLGTGLGESTAQMLYGTGVALGDGLLNGILSADKKLRDAGTYLAKAFDKSFKAAINTGNTAGLSVDTSVMDSINSTSSMTGIGAASVSGRPRQFVVNVTAGIGTDGAAVGKIIVDSIKKYERASGQVFATV